MMPSSVAVRGLSPPTRGSRRDRDRRSDGRRSIPAHAGEPTDSRRPASSVTVYPRPRGGAGTSSRPARWLTGLSPPTRGSHLVGMGAGLHDGSIPAHAGEPQTPRSPTIPTPVYPRPRGGADDAFPGALDPGGLSPPTRGSPHRVTVSGNRRRSIPAHAGEPSMRRPSSEMSRVYPRPRGGAHLERSSGLRLDGLSPPTRGSPCILPRHPYTGPVYPRPRGGADVMMPSSVAVRGLSPPTRGSRRDRDRRSDGRRSIPAHAGEPSTSSGQNRLSAVYPRPRGGAPLQPASLATTIGLLSMAIERCTLLAIEKCTLGIGCRGGSEATGAGTDAWMWSPFMTSPLSWSSRRPPPWRPWGGWTWRVPCDAASGSCCPGC